MLLLGVYIYHDKGLPVLKFTDNRENNFNLFEWNLTQSIKKLPAWLIQKFQTLLTLQDLEGSNLTRLLPSSSSLVTPFSSESFTFGFSRSRATLSNTKPAGYM